MEGLAAKLSIALALAVVLAGCGQELEARWQPVDTVPPRAFETPRDTVVVETNPPIGSLRFDAIVEAQDVAPVVAPVAGDLRSEPRSDSDDEGANGEVLAGEVVATLLPALSAVEELERQILELELELAAKGEGTEEVEIAEAALVAFDAMHEARRLQLVAPRDGVVLGLRAETSRALDQGETAFVIATPGNVRIVTTTSIDGAAGLGTGQSATVALPDGTVADATLDTISPDGPERVELLFQLVNLGVNSLGDLEDSVTVELAPDQLSNAWIPRDAVHRRTGDSYLLVERTDGSLQRVDARLGRRTDTHVELLETSGGLSIEPGAVLVLP